MDKVETAQYLGADRKSEHTPISFVWPEQSRALKQFSQREGEGGKEIGHEEAQISDCRSLWIVRPTYPVTIDDNQNSNFSNSNTNCPCASVICGSDTLRQAAQEVLLEQRKAIPKCGQILVQKYID